MSEFEDRINSILGNPEEMEKIMSLASQFMGGGSGKAEEQKAEPDGRNGGATKQSSGPGPGGLGALGALGDLDGDTLSKIGRLMSQLKGGNDKTELLRAMGPYLKQERREKMEKAIRFARIAKVARAAMREYGGGGDV